MRTAAIILVSLCVCPVGRAAPRIGQTTGGVDSSGGRQQAIGIQHQGLGGTMGSVMQGDGTGLYACSGIFGGMLHGAALDTDQDGLPDAWDADNDNDGLTDVQELSGSAFADVIPTDINTADSDGDGLSDGAEVIAGTDPGDAEDALAVSQVTVSDAGVRLTWDGRRDRHYVISRRMLTPSGKTRQTLGIVTPEVTPSGLSTGPISMEFTDTHPPARSGAIYRIEVQP